MLKSHKYISIVFLFLLIAMSSCRKLAEVEQPFTRLTPAEAFANDENAMATVNGIYTQLSFSSHFSGMGSIGLYASLSADELTLDNAAADPLLNAYYRNELISTAGISYGSEHWSTLYNYVYLCNEIIEQLGTATNLSTSVKSQLRGEALFFRGFFYSYLVNLFGNVPIVTGTEYTKNRLLGKSTKQEIYELITQDLTEARELLSAEFVNATLVAFPVQSSVERVKATKWAAAALLARVYLFNEKYGDANLAASDVLANTALFTLDSLGAVFKKNSNESIWQLQTLKTDQNTDDARLYVLTSTGPSNTQPAYLSEQLYEAFTENDNRKTSWVGTVTSDAGITYHFPFKYQNITSEVLEYTTVLRLAEQYLIRAEAKVYLGDYPGALSDLNVIRRRAGLNDFFADQPGEILEAILNERRLELFTEMGHRWFDLKRIGKVDEVMTAVTPEKTGGQSWNTFQQLYPVLFADIIANPNLTQNPGY